MTPNEIAYYYDIGSLGSFSNKLMELFTVADAKNIKRLKDAFPEYYEAYQLWYYRPEGWNVFALIGA